MRLRHPGPEDGQRIWRLVDAAGTLELNSAYFYVLMASQFADTCLVAEADGKLHGFVVGHRPPRQSDTLFVWQVAVAPSGRGQGLGRRMLLELLRRTDSRWLEATVAPSNAASRALFSSAANHLDCPCQVGPFLGAELFPDDHEAEDRFRIGPIPTRPQPAA